MRLLNTFLLILAGLWWATNVFACMFNTDCQPGSQCYKPGGGLYGWCVGGLNPGNANDNQPASDPLDITHRKGNTCQFNTDCGAGGQCIKGASIYGTCL